jgi:hypothetical protein
MEGPTIFLALVIIAAVFYIAHTFTMQRRKKLAAFAQSKGWTFSHEKDKGMDNRYPAFICLKRGHSRWAYNIIRGDKNGIKVTAFDYHYVTGHGKNRRVCIFSAIIVQTKLSLKPLYLRPEHIFDKVSDFFGFDDIDFESAEFSRKFYVKAPEKRWAYDVIHQRMMEYLLESPQFNLQFEQKDIMAWRDRRFTKKDFEDAFSLLQGILNRLPEYVKKQQMDQSKKA